MVSALRTPVVIGLHRGAGTSTVAAALHANEGSGQDPGADIVCVGEHALSRALALVTPLAGPLPVLVVGAGPVPGPPPRVLGSRFGAVVLIPHLAWWAGAAPPFDEIAMLLGLPAQRLPQPLQAYAAALRDIAAAVMRSGQLTHSSPPVVLRPRVPLAPAAHPAPATRPTPEAAPLPQWSPDGSRRNSHAAHRDRLPGTRPGDSLDDSSNYSPDDDTLEASGFAAAGRVG